MAEQSEVPLDLQNALAGGDEPEQISLDMSGLEDWPPQNWHDCRDCGTRLHPQRYLKDADGTVTAVKYTCSGSGSCGSIWVWERARDQLYYDGEVEVVQAFDHDLDEDS